MTPTVIPTHEGVTYLGEPWVFQDLATRPTIEELGNLENIWDRIDKREQILYVPSSKIIPVVIKATNRYRWGAKSLSRELFDGKDYFGKGNYQLIILATVQ